MPRTRNTARPSWRGGAPVIPFTRMQSTSAAGTDMRPILTTGVTRLKKDSVRARRSSLKNAYGISLEDYARLLVRQGGVCAICLKAPAERLCVDHCHATGKVRGLLCRTCNVGLGCYRDDPSLVTAAAAYLRKAKTAQRRSRPSPWGGLIGSIGAEMPCTCTEVSKNRKIRRMTSKN